MMYTPASDITPGGHAPQAQPWTVSVDTVPTVVPADSCTTAHYPFAFRRPLGGSEACITPHYGPFAPSDTEIASVSETYTRTSDDRATPEDAAEAALLEMQYNEAWAALPPHYREWLDETAGTIEVDCEFDAADLPYAE